MECTVWLCFYLLRCVSRVVVTMHNTAKSKAMSVMNSEYPQM
jgi:hypothetical protein